MNKIVKEALTYDDVLLIPGASSFTPNMADLTTRLSDDITLNIPLMSAAMDTVTESRLAIAMAREGGIGIIHKNMSIDSQAENIDRVKRSEHGVITDPFYLYPECLLSDAVALMNKYRISGVPITDHDGKLVGILTNRDMRFETDYTQKIGDIMTKDRLVTAPEGTSLDEAQKILGKHPADAIRKPVLNRSPFNCLCNLPCTLLPSFNCSILKLIHAFNCFNQSVKSFGTVLLKLSMRTIKCVICRPGIFTGHIVNIGINILCDIP